MHAAGRFPGRHADLDRMGRSLGAAIDRQAWFLFAILFLWQFPHFLAIALMYRDDYGRAGYRMLAAFRSGLPLYPRRNCRLYRDPGG